MNSDIEEITLPTLPVSEPSLPTAPISHTGRKRPFLRSREPSSYEDQLAEVISTSSDPALFSNDDAPDAENYSNGTKKRKKKTYEGTWWGEKLRKPRVVRVGPVDSAPKKRQFRRNFDSGIFMVDDSSTTDLSSEGSLEQELLNEQGRQNAKATSLDTNGHQEDKPIRKPKVHRSFKFASEAALEQMTPGRPINPKDHLIRKVVQDCLDKNEEHVDWTGMGLDYLPPAVTDLKLMIKRIGCTSSYNRLAPFEAELKILLGNNNFTRIPQPIFEITNIQLLSVRQNQLSELSPSIRNLVNLCDLNLGSNRLRYLPYEVLQLFRHKQLNNLLGSSNPWMPLPPAKDRLAGAPSIAIVLPKKGLGLVLRRFAVCKIAEVQPNGSLQYNQDTFRRASKQPHLSEMVLRALVKHNPSKTDLSSYLTSDHPQSVRTLLDALHAVQSSGGLPCTFCQRDMVMPRYLWYEWWDILYNAHAIDPSGQTPGPVTTHEDGSQPDSEFYLEQPDAIDPGAEPTKIVRERILPFQRAACGCVDVGIGLDREAAKLREDGVPVRIDLEPWQEW